MEQQASPVRQPNRTEPTAADAHADMSIHVIPPTWQPLIMAIGLTLTLSGMVIAPILWIVGLVIVIVSTANWLGLIRGDLRHGGHGGDVLE